MDVNNHRIINCVDPIDLQDVATKNYVDSAGTGISLAEGKLNFYTLNGSGSNVSANLNMNSHQIKGITNGSDLQDCVSFS